MDPKTLIPLFLPALVACTSSASIDYRPAPPRATLEDPSVVEAMGHRREVHIDQGGWMRIVFVRENEHGQRVEVEAADYLERVAPSLERLEDLPAPIGAWIARCPSLRDAVAEALEQGATFRGFAEREGGVRGPYFWATRGNGAADCPEERAADDPLDALVGFLLAAQHAAAAPAYRAIERSVVSGEMERVEARAAVARVRAEHVVRVVALVSENEDCLGLARLGPGRGPGYRRLAAQVADTLGAPDALARRMQRQPEAFESLLALH